MLWSASDYKEQLVDSDGGVILLNIRNLSFQTILYLFYGVVSLFNNYKNVNHDNILLHYWHNFPPQPPQFLSLITNHHEKINWLYNMIFIPPSKKPRGAKENFHPAILMSYYSVCINLNEEVSFKGVSVLGLNFFNGKTNWKQ